MIRALAIVLVASATACSGDDAPTPELTRDELLDPETCMTCHPTHYREWSSSMHAYASEDPVFRAMNARGQRETAGALGDFCINCHAPMAVREGLTTDGLNIDEVPDHLHGVTCYFCHNATEVTDDHNNPIVLANDTTMRGGLREPAANRGHASEHSTLHDGSDLGSSQLCGSCHDIVTPAGVHLERTFAEWRDSLFNSEDPARKQTCVSCHMRGFDGVAAVDPEAGVGRRRIHEHLMPGIDVALTPFVDEPVQRLAIGCDLQPAIIATVCVTPRYEFQVTLETANVGHSWPSGAGQDRRAWVEFVGYQGDTVLYQSGVVADGDPVVDSPSTDLWQIRDFTFDDAGGIAHMFWNVATVDSRLLPVVADPGTPHSISRTYVFGGGIPDRATIRLRIRPLGLDVVDDLIGSGDLDPAIRARIPTFTVEGASIDWTTDDGFECITRSSGEFLFCPAEYRCMLDPDFPGCDRI